MRQNKTETQQGKIKSCSNGSSTQGTLWWQVANSKRLMQSHSYSTNFWRPSDFSLGVALLTTSLPSTEDNPCSWFLQLPGISIALSGSLSHLHTLHSQGTLLGLPGFPLKDDWKTPWPYNSCTLHAYKTGTTWMTPKAVVRSSISLPVLNDGYKASYCLRGWILWAKSQGINSWGHSSYADYPEALYSNKDLSLYFRA